MHMHIHIHRHRHTQSILIRRGSRAEPSAKHGAAEPLAEHASGVVNQGLTTPPDSGLECIACHCNILAVESQSCHCFLAPSLCCREKEGGYFVWVNFCTRCCKGTNSWYKETQNKNTFPPPLLPVSKWSKCFQQFGQMSMVSRVWANVLMRGLWYQEFGQMQAVANGINRLGKCLWYQEFGQMCWWEVYGIKSLGKCRQ